MLRNVVIIVFVWAFGMVLSSHRSVRQSAAVEPIPTAPAPIAPAPHTFPYHIYLTFDDGPSAGSRLVDSLARADSVDINVFLVGKNASNSAIRRSVLENYRNNPFVELGNHSYTHAESHYKQYFRDPEMVLADFERNRDSLRLPTMLCRLPGRNVFRVAGMGRDECRGEEAAADSLTGNGYSIYGWDIEWRIKPAPGMERHSPTEMLELIQQMLTDKKTFVSNNIIVLVHDQEFNDTSFASDMAAFVRLARADGRFDFGHLSSYK